MNFFLIIWLYKIGKNMFALKNVSICFVGDIIPHQAVVKKNRKVPNLFTYVSNEISKYDIAVGNLEGPCAESYLRHYHRRAFNAPQRFLKDLKQAGFDVLNIANNHIYDCQYEGVKQTIYNLQKHSFIISGFATNKMPCIAIIEKNNIKIGIMGITTILNWLFWGEGKTNVAYYENPDDCLEYIKEASKKVDYLIINIHWGEEYKAHLDELRKIAQKIFNAGADCIIGHHPHILLPVEYEKDFKKYKNIAAYSVGNFIANMGREYKTFKSSYKEGSARRSVIFSIHLSKTVGRAYAVKIKAVPVWIHNNYLDYYGHKTGERLVFPVLIKDYPEQILSAKAKDFEIKQIYRALRLDETFSF